MARVSPWTPPPTSEHLELFPSKDLPFLSLSSHSCGHALHLAPHPRSSSTSECLDTASPSAQPAVLLVPCPTPTTWPTARAHTRAHMHTHACTCSQCSCACTHAHAHAGAHTCSCACAHVSTPVTCPWRTDCLNFHLTCTLVLSSRLLPRIAPPCSANPRPLHSVRLSPSPRGS